MTHAFWNKPDSTTKFPDGSTEQVTRGGRLCVTTSADGARVRIIHQPGNGTRYEAVATKIPGRPDWVVAFPESFGVSYTFSEGHAIDWGYVQSKFAHKAPTGYPLGKVDASEMAKVIAMAVPDCIVGDTCTGDDGEFIDQHHHQQGGAQQT